MPPKLIVGVDAGVTKAVAVVAIDDLGAETYSEKNASFSDLCAFVASHGSPVVVTSDRRDSRLARKLAAAFSAALFNPHKNLTLREKSRLVHRHGRHAGNSHEKDALAAALYARTQYAKLLRKIRYRIARNDGVGEVASLVIRKKAHNIAKAFTLSGETERSPARRRRTSIGARRQ